MQSYEIIAILQWHSVYVYMTNYPTEWKYMYTRNLISNSAQNCQIHGIKLLANFDFYVSNISSIMRFV